VNDLPQNKARRLLAVVFQYEYENRKKRSRRNAVPSFRLQKDRKDGAEETLFRLFISRNAIRMEHCAFFPGKRSKQLTKTLTGIK
jgi:hypothetical protein